MNFPHIAYRTFQRLKDHPYFSKFVLSLRMAFSEMISPVQRARFAHKQVDEALDELWKANPLAAQATSCKKGCTACCHTQVSVTKDEAELLACRVGKDVLIDQERLERQARAKDSSSEWYKLSYEDRRCVFLGSDGECQVYEDRPSVCRSNYVFSPPEDCLTKDGNIRPVRLLIPEKADMVTMAHFLESRDNGDLPRLLKQNLDKRKDQKRRRVFPTHRLDDADVD